MAGDIPISAFDVAAAELAGNPVSAAASEALASKVGAAKEQLIQMLLTADPSMDPNTLGAIADDALKHLPFDVGANEVKARAAFAKALQPLIGDKGGASVSKVWEVVQAAAGLTDLRSQSHLTAAQNELTKAMSSKASQKLRQALTGTVVPTGTNPPVTANKPPKTIKAMLTETIRTKIKEGGQVTEEGIDAYKGIRSLEKRGFTKILDQKGIEKLFSDPRFIQRSPEVQALFNRLAGQPTAEEIILDPAAVRARMAETGATTPRLNPLAQTTNVMDRGPVASAYPEMNPAARRIEAARPQEIIRRLKVDPTAVAPDIMPNVARMHPANAPRVVHAPGIPLPEGPGDALRAAITQSGPSTRKVGTRFRAYVGDVQVGSFRSKKAALKAANKASVALQAEARQFGGQILPGRIAPNTELALRPKTELALRPQAPLPYEGTTALARTGYQGTTEGVRIPQKLLGMEPLADYPLARIAASAESGGAASLMSRLLGAGRKVGKAAAVGAGLVGLDALLIGGQEVLASREHKRQIEEMELQAKLQRQYGQLSTPTQLKMALMQRKLMKSRALDAQLNPQLAEQQRMAMEQQTAAMSDSVPGQLTF